MWKEEAKVLSWMLAIGIGFTLVLPWLYRFFDLYYRWVLSVGKS